jgi:hypothetical protein
VFHSMEEHALTTTGFLIHHARRAAPNQTASSSPGEDFLLITSSTGISGAQGARLFPANLSYGYVTM